MSASEDADLARRLLWARCFLYGRQAALYGARALRFDLEKGYRDFDGMLKRDIYFARFEVREVVAEARAEFPADAVILQVHRLAGLAPAQGGAPRFEDFLRFRGLFPDAGAPPKQVDLGGRLHEVVLSRSVPARPDPLELRLVPLPGPASASGRRIRPSLRALREEWISSLLAGWIGTGSPLRLDGGEQPLRLPRTLAWTVSRRISQVDVDISGEDPPHVFRWKEIALAGASTGADWDDADVSAALAASGVVLPGNAHRQAKLQEDLGQGRSCLRLRYAHLIPDPDGGAGGDGATVPPRLSAGHIVMENDYLEILIDAGTGKVFSEAWKWRPEPDS